MNACAICGRALKKPRPSGKCRSCFQVDLNRNPETRAKRINALRATIMAPAYRDRLQARLTQISRSRLAWCPLEYRDLYRQLTRAKMLSAQVARSMVEELVAADLKRHHAGYVLPQSIRLCDALEAM